METIEALNIIDACLGDKLSQRMGKIEKIRNNNYRETRFVEKSKNYINSIIEHLSLQGLFVSGLYVGKTGDSHDWKKEDEGIINISAKSIGGKFYFTPYEESGDDFQIEHRAKRMAREFEESIKGLSVSIDKYSLEDNETNPDMKGYENTVFLTIKIK